MEKERILYLYQHFINKTGSPEELSEFSAILADKELNEMLKEALDEELLGMSEADIKDVSQETANRIFQSVIATQPQRRTIIRRLWPRVAAAAAIIIVTGAGLFYYSQKNKSNQTSQQFVQEIKPGGNKAVLTLANGKRISLTDAANGGIAKQSGISITKTADGKVIYAIEHNNHNSPISEYNTIETPKGGQYQIQLPDGTTVWLNATSSLKYPTSFASRATRRVELTGEGYFEVAKDKLHPFIVHTDKQEVEVLGTHFNINSYNDEPGVATTLLEGSVKIIAGANKQILTPGEQAVNNGNAIKVSEANIENVTDWKDGDFYLNRIDFKVAMRKIARWYSVDVVFDGNVPEGIESGGWMSRDTKLSTVLKAIEKSGQVHFKVEGKKIYVSK